MCKNDYVFFGFCFLNTCIYIIYMHFYITQEHMEYFRSRRVHEITTNKLMPY